MIKQILSILENHVEKIVLGIVGVICFWLLITQVLFSPNQVKYDNRTFSPGEIDSYINEKAQKLLEQLEVEPQSKESYQPRLDNYAALMESSVRDISINHSLPYVMYVARDVKKKGIYSLPEIGDVNNLEAHHIRAVAYVPTEEITPESPYSEETSEPNDVDLVTVEGHFDIGRLREEFNRKFAGEDVAKQEWRDPCLAEPVFAAVDLQRQEQIQEDKWGAWERVPRLGLSGQEKLFAIIENVNDLPAGGIELRLHRYNNSTVQAEVLQPEAYQIASADEAWFPPSLYADYSQYQREEEIRKRKEEMETRREEEKKIREERLEKRGIEPRERDRGDRESESETGVPPELLEMMGGISGGSDRLAKRRERREEERSQRGETQEEEKTLDDIYKSLDDIMIGKEIKLSEVEKTINFWAHDDTAEPGHSYRYRIRIGVFNPIAGTDQLSEAEKERDGQVILWSDFSEPTEVLLIPKRMYVFPLDIQEMSKALTVQVSRYELGYWYTHDFTINQGDAIGKPMEPQLDEDSEEEEEEKGKESEEELELPSVVDYATGLVYVDAVGSNKWYGSGELRQRYYFDMLYTEDGSVLKRMAIKSRNWSRDQQRTFSQIQRAANKEREPLRKWNEQGSMGGRISPRLPKGGGIGSGEEFLKKLLEQQQPIQ